MSATASRKSGGKIDLRGWSEQRDERGHIFMRHEPTMQRTPAFVKPEPAYAAARRIQRAMDTGQLPQGVIVDKESLPFVPEEHASTDYGRGTSVRSDETPDAETVAARLNFCDTLPEFQEAVAEFGLRGLMENGDDARFPLKDLRRIEAALDDCARRLGANGYAQKPTSDAPATAEDARGPAPDSETPAMPADLADAGWELRQEEDEWYGWHEDLFLSSEHGTDPRAAIEATYRARDAALPPAVVDAREHADSPPAANSGVRDLPLPLVVTDAGTQARAGLNEQAVEEYKDAMLAGETFPAGVAFYDSGRYFCAAGFHRHEAAVRAGRETFPFEVRKGGRREALIYSLSDNARHGLRLSNADKRRKVELALADEELSKWSNREIASLCGGFSHSFVGDVREALTGSRTPAEVLARRGDTEYTVSTAGITAGGRRGDQPVRVAKTAPAEDEVANAYREHDHYGLTLDEYREAVGPIITGPRTIRTKKSEAKREGEWARNGDVISYRGKLPTGERGKHVEYKRVLGFDDQGGLVGEMFPKPKGVPGRIIWGNAATFHEATGLLYAGDARVSDDWLARHGDDRIPGQVGGLSAMWRDLHESEQVIEHYRKRKARPVKGSSRSDESSMWANCHDAAMLRYVVDEIERAMESPKRREERRLAKSAEVEDYDAALTPQETPSKTLIAPSKPSVAPSSAPDAVRTPAERPKTAKKDDAESVVMLRALDEAGERIAARASGRGATKALLAFLVEREMEFAFAEADAVARRRGLAFEEREGDEALKKAFARMSVNQMVGLLAELIFQGESTTDGPCEDAERLLKLYSVDFDKVKASVETKLKKEQEKKQKIIKTVKDLVAAIEAAESDKDLDRLVREHKLATDGFSSSHQDQEKIKTALLAARLRLNVPAPDASLPTPLPARIEVPMSRLGIVGGGDMGKALDTSLGWASVFVEKTFTYEGRLFCAHGAGSSGDGREDVHANELIPLSKFSGKVYELKEWKMLGSGRYSSWETGVAALYKAKAYVMVGAHVKFFNPGEPEEEAQVVYVEPERLQSRYDGSGRKKGGDIAESYSAQSVSERGSKVRNPFTHEGSLYVSTGGLSGGLGRPADYTDAWRIVPRAEYKGRTFNYPGRLSPENGYEGMRVMYGKNEYVMTGPELRFKPRASAPKRAAEPTDEELFQQARNLDGRALSLLLYCLIDGGITAERVRRETGGAGSLNKLVKLGLVEDKASRKVTPLGRRMAEVWHARTQAQKAERQQQKAATKKTSTKSELLQKKAAQAKQSATPSGDEPAGDPSKPCSFNIEHDGRTIHVEYTPADENELVHFVFTGDDIHGEIKLSAVAESATSPLAKAEEWACGHFPVRPSRQKGVPTAYKTEKAKPAGSKLKAKHERVNAVLRETLYLQLKVGDTVRVTDKSCKNTFGQRGEVEYVKGATVRVKIARHAYEYTASQLTLEKKTATRGPAKEAAFTDGPAKCAYCGKQVKAGRTHTHTAAGKCAEYNLPAATTKH